MTTYHQEKALLNPAQREAVEHIYGPSLVLAGPGSGKTRVLTFRILEILDKTDTKPEQILALTFTESAAANMQNRLRDYLGSDATKLQISTFHGFCSDIIARYSESFPIHALETADDIAKYRIFEKILAKKAWKHFSKLYRGFSHIPSILSAISSLKREGVAPKHFVEVIAAEEEEFLSIPEEEKMNAKTGKMKGKYADQEKAIGKWKELSEIYESYNNALREEGLMDFEDQILFVLEALEKDEQLRSILQEQYLFMLSDEFQDSNSAQMRILQLLAGEDPQANLFAVGDDDQSIYRFQGANLENIAAFLRHFPETKLTILDTNYRSTKAIVRAAKSCMEKSSTSLEKLLKLEKKLEAAKDEGEKPLFLQFPEEESEHFYILEQIKQMHAAGVPLKEIALLVRKNAEGREMLRFLEANSINATFATTHNALENLPLQSFLQLLELIHLPNTLPTSSKRQIEERMRILLFALLHSPMLDFSQAEIWTLWREIRRSEEGLFCFAGQQGVIPQSHFARDTVTPCVPNTEETPPSPPSPAACPSRGRQGGIKLQAFFDQLEHWGNKSRELYLLDFLGLVLEESGLTKVLFHAPVDYEGITAIHSLLQETKRFLRAQKNAGLGELLEHLRLFQQYGLPLKTKTLESTPDAVQILTAHRAKGLEFHTVFLLHAANGVWGNTRGGRGIKLPTGLLEFPEMGKDEAKEEERRLFYVAMTRAKEQLYLTFSKKRLDDKEQIPTPFLDDIDADFYETEEVEPSFSEERFLASTRPNLAEKPALAELSTKLLENFSLSHSAFENYRECPRKFLYENLLRMPGERHLTATLGTAVHKALEVFFGRGDFRKALLLSTFDTALGKELLSPSEHEEMSMRGHMILNAYYALYEGGFQKAYATELGFRPGTVMLGEAQLTGRIDKIDRMEGNRMRIVDYKTKQAMSENDIRGLTKTAQNVGPRAGSHYRQLQFYKILCDRSTEHQFSAEEFVLDFVHDEPLRRSFLISAEETEELQTEIQEIWQKIMELKFLEPEDCQVEDCPYCRMLFGE